jgi:hypothetical protein
MRRSERICGVYRGYKRGLVEALRKVSNTLFAKATRVKVTVIIYYLNSGENQPTLLIEIVPLQIFSGGSS